MEEEQTKKNVPLWAWALGCLGVLAFCAVVFVIGSAISIFVISDRSSNSLSDAPSMDAPAVAVEPSLIPGEDDPGASGSDRPLPPTNTPDTGSDAIDGGVDDAGQEPVDDPFAAERAEIEANVVEIRQLQPREDVTPTTLTMPQLRQRLEEEFAEDYSPEEARLDALTLSAFDFLSPEFDIYNFTLDLFAEEIAGFYDPETDEFVTISDDPEFDTLEQWTYAHEYVHALQDQYYDLEILTDDSLKSEAAFALQALAEGDATLVQTQYLTGGYFEQKQLLELLGDSLTLDTAVLDSAPPILARQLEFPYISGLAFVEALFAQGGYEAVDQAWQNLPQSSEHILHPDRYLAGDQPQLVSLEPMTDTLGDGWSLVDEDSLGEFYLRQHLAQQLDEDEVDLAATGWGGDLYAVYMNESQDSLVMVLRQSWDTPADAQEFADAYTGYPAGLFGTNAAGQENGGLCWQGQDVICLYSAGDETLIVRAPDTGIAANIAALQIP